MATKTPSKSSIRKRANSIISSTLLAVILLAHPEIESFVDRLPVHEILTITDVAAEYELSGIRLRLLLAIRVQENGGCGLEFGVGDGNASHPARRHTGDPKASLRLQASWAAGTIKRRFNGRLDLFAQRYCPFDWETWEKNVRALIE